MKGKPWTVEEENRLRQLLKAHKSARAIARAMGKSRECVSMKIARLGLEVVTGEKNPGVTTTSNLAALGLPPELPSIEEQLKVLAAVLKALEAPSVQKNDVLRLRAIIQGVKVYQELLAEYVDYRGIEKKLIDLEAKYDRLLEGKAKVGTSEQVPSAVARAPEQVGTS